MLCHRWAVPPNPCKYDKYYKNPVLKQTFIYQFGSPGFYSSSPGRMMWNAGTPRTSFSITRVESESA